MLRCSQFSVVKSDRHSAFLQGFGRNLKQVREEKGLSQEKLAFTSELSISQISRIERGVINTSLSQLVSISQALGIQPYELLKFNF